MMAKLADAISDAYKAMWNMVRSEVITSQLPDKSWCFVCKSCGGFSLQLGGIETFTKGHHMGCRIGNLIEIMEQLREALADQGQQDIRCNTEGPHD